MSIEFLRRLPLFAGLSDSDLKHLYDQAQTIEVPSGELLIEEGTVGDTLYVLLEGELEVTKRSGRHDVKLDVRRAGSVVGEMALLDRVPRTASIRAIEPSRLVVISKDDFEHVLSGSPTAALAILHTVTARLRQNEALLHEKEKLAGLGTLAAGLAHELNNPAAAVQRAVAQLRDLLVDWQNLAEALGGLGLTPEQSQKVRELRASLAGRASASLGVDPLELSDRESELQDWLEGRGVDDAWDLAPTLASFGWTPAELEGLEPNFSPEQFSVLVRALATGGSTYALLDAASKGAERISEIVKAVKTYSYLDRAPVQQVDVHEGLDNTLVILRHKLKSGVQVTRQYAPDLPRIEAFASELNQVWTNIIDNAIDAMKGQGEIVLRTYAKDQQVVVELIDNGPGVPPDVRPRVFEPFFTTKPPGVGSGLGLHIAYNIVEKHGGEIRVDSEPGRTCFSVSLPLQLKRG